MYTESTSSLPVIAPVTDENNRPNAIGAYSPQIHRVKEPEAMATRPRTLEGRRRRRARLAARH